MLPVRKTTRGMCGTYLTLTQLIKVLPTDYMVRIKHGDVEVWKGIAWVYMYDSVFYRFKDAYVMKFEIDYNNTEVEISIITHT